MPKLLCCLPLAALLITASPATFAAHPRHPSQLTPSQRLHALFDAEWERRLREDPQLASQLGDHRYDDRWGDVSLAAQQRHNDEDQAALKAVRAIPQKSLSETDRLDAELFQQQLEDRLQSYHFHEYLRPVDHIYGLQSAQGIVELLPFETVQDYRNWIARLHGFGEYTDETIALMREGIAEKQVKPRAIMALVSAQIAAQIVEHPQDSPFYAPFRKFPDSLTAEQQQQLRAAGAEEIAKVVVPAFRRFQAFFNIEYLPACQDSIAVTALPDGEAYYAYLIRHHTTTGLTPQQIHQIGLDEVKRIRGEMDAIIQQVGFKGSFEEFSTYLRSDPQFYYKDPQALLTAYQALAKRIDGELPRLFDKLPRLPYGVRPIPDESAPYQTTAYYQPGSADGLRAGFYYVNLYKPETRPKWEMEALTAHEAVPGHHLQIALAQELKDLPDFRKFGDGYTAFHEGWALYAESLGDQLGLYRDPYSKYGQLAFEMWRACRLVVDTGMHAMGWSREQAIDYMVQNTPRARHDLEVEVDRYIAWPGQALAYKIGQMKITALRDKAKAALGDRFDIRAFHDVVLGDGDIPLDVLERKVDAWIEQSRKP